MKRLIPGVRFSDGEYYPCDFVVLDAMLQFYGYATPLVLHDQWFFLYQRRDDGGVQVIPRLTSFFQRMQQCGIHVTEHRGPDGEMAWERVRARIDRGHPVAVSIDTYPLEIHYFPGIGERSGHGVILAGYDDEAETVHVVDASPIVQFRGDVPLSEFKEAWGSEAIPCYLWLEFQVSEPRWTLTAEQAVQTVQQNIRLMLQEKAPLPGAFIGLQGLRTLADDVAEWKDLKADPARTYLKPLFDQVRFVVMERDGHSKYLKRVADRLESPNLAHVGEQLRVISQKWLVFRNLCFKGHKKSLEQTLGKLHSRLLEIASLEEKTLMQLQATLPQ